MLSLLAPTQHESHRLSAPHWSRRRRVDVWDGRCPRGHPNEGGVPALPLALFASGLLVLATGLYLDQRDDVEPKYADAGVFLGVGGILTAIGLFLF